MQALETQVELLGVLGDATRLRLLHLLGAHELSVGEVVQVTGLGQSRVSTHLGKLREQGLVADRRSGTSTYYRFNGAMPERARRLWDVLEGQLDDGSLAQDVERASQVVRARQGRWPETLAGEMEHHYSPGRTWDALLRALVGLLRLGDVLDIGSGDGTVAAMLAGQARSVTCLDISAPLLDAAASRCTPATGARMRFVQGDVQSLPFCEARFDQVLFLNTLAHTPSPTRALAEATRVLRPGGTLVLVTLSKHPHLDVAGQYGHRQPGFEASWLRRRLKGHGLEVLQCDRTSRERRQPHFEVITCFARKPESKA